MHLDSVQGGLQHGLPLHALTPEPGGLLLDGAHSGQSPLLL